MHRRTRSTRLSCCWPRRRASSTRYHRPGGLWTCRWLRSRSGSCSEYSEGATERCSSFCGERRVSGPTEMVIRIPAKVHLQPRDVRPWPLQHPCQHSTISCRSDICIIAQHSPRSRSIRSSSVHARTPRPACCRSRRDAPTRTPTGAHRHRYAGHRRTSSIRQVESPKGFPWSLAGRACTRGRNWRL